MGPWAIVIFALLAPVMVGALVSGYEGHASFALNNGYIVAFLALLLAALAIGVVSSLFYRASVVRRYGHLADEPEEPEAGPAQWRELAAQLNEAERERRVEDLLSVDCPERPCRAVPGMGCAMAGMAVIMLRRDPLAFCHFSRARRAVRSGNASREDVAAQFDGRVPEGVL